MNEVAIDALRSGSRLADEKLESLRAFAKNLITNRGKATSADLQAFFAAGYTDAQALEVILGLAIKLMSNFTNSIAGTPLDEEVESLRWKSQRFPNARLLCERVVEFQH